MSSLAGTRDRLGRPHDSVLGGQRPRNLSSQLRIPGAFLTAWPEKFCRSSEDTAGGSTRPSCIEPYSRAWRGL